MTSTVTTLDFELLATVPAITRAMDYVGTALHQFTDGTAALWDDEVPECIYSPRLALPQLEAFCEEHEERYKAFHIEHQAAIEDGDTVPLAPWWGLPNPSTTWGKPIESFDDWHARVQPNGGSLETDQLLYLTEQLRQEGVALIEVRFNHPLLGLLSHLGEHQQRARELLHAYLAYVVARDAGPMKRVIAGERLQPNLHLDYVAATACYGNVSIDLPWVWSEEKVFVRENRNPEYALDNSLVLDLEQIVAAGMQYLLHQSGMAAAPSAVYSKDAAADFIQTFRQHSQQANEFEFLRARLCDTMATLQMPWIGPRLAPLAMMAAYLDKMICAEPSKVTDADRVFGDLSLATAAQQPFLAYDQLPIAIDPAVLQALHHLANGHEAAPEIIKSLAGLGLAHEVSPNVFKPTALGHALVNGNFVPDEQSPASATD